MVKPEWGTKRTCPKCNTRFYDLQQDDPVTCINCGMTWIPEPILKSKQPLPFETAKPKTADVDEADEALAEDDLDIDEAAAPDGDDVDLGDDEDLAGVVERDDEDEV